MARTAQQIVDERVRTIEQIKRLYAVVMGFAMTTCIANVYGCIHALPEGNGFAAWQLVAQGLAFGSLIALFYLGAERLLETRYLRPGSPVPKPLGLLSDLVLCAVTSVYFVVLANTFPDYTKATVVAQLPTAVGTEFHAFVHNLLVLYAVDGLFLILQIARLLSEHPEEEQEAVKAHLLWLSLNVFSLFVLGCVLPGIEYVERVGGAISFAAMCLAGWHVARFLFDFLFTFPFYYPNDPVPAAP